MSLFLLFFSLYFSFFYLREYLSPLVHLRWTKKLFSVSFFPFLYIYIYNFQYLGRVEGKTVLSCTYRFQRVYFSCSFLLRTSDIHLRIGWVSLSADYCPKSLFYAFYGPPGALANKSAHLFTPTAVLKLKSLFQISSDEEVLLLALKASASHLASFFLISISSGHITQWPTFPSLSNQL